MTDETSSVPTSPPATPTEPPASRSWPSRSWPSRSEPPSDAPQRRRHRIATPADRPRRPARRRRPGPVRGQVFDFGLFYDAGLAVDRHRRRPRDPVARPRLRNREQGMVIGGTVVTTVGLVLLYQNQTGSVGELGLCLGARRTRGQRARACSCGAFAPATCPATSATALWALLGGLAIFASASSSSRASSASAAMPSGVAGLGAAGRRDRDRRGHAGARPPRAARTASPPEVPRSAIPPDPMAPYP